MPSTNVLELFEKLEKNEESWLQKLKEEIDSWLVENFALKGKFEFGAVWAFLAQTTHFRLFYVVDCFMDFANVCSFKRAFKVGITCW